MFDEQINEEEIQDKSAHLAGRFYQLFEEPPKIKTTLYGVDNLVPIYSYDRIATLVLEGIIYGLLSRGTGEEEVISIICSKQIRWALDIDGDELFNIGRMLSEGMELNI